MDIECLCLVLSLIVKNNGLNQCLPFTCEKGCAHLYDMEIWYCFGDCSDASSSVDLSSAQQKIIELGEALPVWQQKLMVAVKVLDSIVQLMLRLVFEK